jgi:hypothetical protein
MDTDPPLEAGEADQYADSEKLPGERLSNECGLEAELPPDKIQLVGGGCLCRGLSHSRSVCAC